MICVCKQKNWKPGCNSGLVWRSENQGNWWCSSWSESKSPRTRGTGCVRTGENRSASLGKERTNLPAGGTVVKNPPANPKRHKRLGFDPWVWKTPPWSRKWQPTPLFLPLKPHRQRRLAGTVHRVAKSLTWPNGFHRFILHSHGWEGSSLFSLLIQMIFVVTQGRKSR